MVNQGDLLHGDANGVTNIPREIADEVADIAGEFVAAEAIMLDYVKSPAAKRGRGVHGTEKGVSGGRRQAHGASRSPRLVALVMR